MKIENINSIDDFKDFNIDFFLDNIDFSKYNLWNITLESNKKQFLVILNQIIQQGRVTICSEKDQILCILGFKELYWDSHYFGFKSAKIEILTFAKNIENNLKTSSLKLLISEIHDYLITERFNHCMADISSWDSIISDQLQINKFKYILSWGDCFRNSCRTSLLNNNYEISPIYENELDYITSLSKDYFKGGRFYLDNNFSTDKVNSMYEKLIKNSFRNKSTTILTLRKNNDPIGAFLCKKIEYSFTPFFNVRSLRLLVFDKKKSFPGLATSFISDTANILFDNYNCNLVVSGLEMHNLPSLKIHTKANYKLNYTHNVYHWWNKSNNK